MARRSKNNREVHIKNLEQEEAVIETLARAFAKIASRLDQPNHRFVKNFRKALMDILIEEDPRITAAELALRTGIDRRHASEYLRTGDITTWKKHNKLPLILEDLKKLSDRKYPDRMIPKKGKNSFTTVCIEHANGSFTPNIILKELTRLGHTIPHGKTTVELVSWEYGSSDKQIAELQEQATHMNRLAQAVNLSQDGSDENAYVSSVATTKIPPLTLEKVEKDIKNTLKKASNQVENLLKKHEVEVPEGTFPEYGATVFKFNAN